MPATLRLKCHLVVVLFALLAARACLATDLTLWYQQPANNTKPMDEALAIGNGRMGGLIFGAPERERICINEDSLWTGDENPSGNDNTMGSYQVFGNVFVNIAGQSNAMGYRRELDLGAAQARVRYEAGGVRYLREFFCSHPAGVLVARFTAEKPHSFSGSVEMDDAHKAVAALTGNRLAASGKLSNGLKYEWQAVVTNDGGSLTARGSTLEFKDCDGLTLLITAGTDYAMNYAKGYRGDDPHARVTAALAAAARASYAELKAAQEKDYQTFFNRVTLDLGTSSLAQMALATDKRKIEAA